MVKQKVKVSFFAVVFSRTIPIIHMRIKYQNSSITDKHAKENKFETSSPEVYFKVTPRNQRCAYPPYENVM